MTSCLPSELSLNCWDNSKYCRLKLDYVYTYAPNFSLRAQIRRPLIIQRHIQRRIQRPIHMHPIFSLQAQIRRPLATATATTLSVTTEAVYPTATGVTTMTIVETTATKRGVVRLNNILCIYYSAYSVIQGNGVALPMSTCMWLVCTHM
jgi:hypothetical protein